KVGRTDDEFIEQTASTGRPLYAAEHRRTTHRAVTLDLPNSEDVRAPGEAPGLMAIESAMDELAYALDIDPVELRIKNDAKERPELDVPFGDRRLVECLREGARRFGWERRPKRVASVRDGRWLVGYGMASSLRPHFQGPTEIKVRLDADGQVVVQSDMTDVGTGTYTILAQLASDELGVPIDRVRVELGDSSLPPSTGSGASWGASNSCLALARACRALRDQIIAAVSGDEHAPAANLPALGAEKVPSGGLEAVGSIVGMWDEPNFKSHSLIAFG